MTAPSQAAPPQQPADQTRPPLWRDVRVLRAVLQVVFAVAVVALLTYLYSNLLANLRGQGIRTDFGYLDRPAGFQILGSDFRGSQRNREALVVGLTNTAMIAVLGIVLTTILGVILGVARLSTNWLVRKAASFYVEAFRNQPPLVVIFFVFTALVLQFPRIESPLDVAGLLVVTNRTVSVAWPTGADSAGVFLVVVVVGLALAAMVWLWRTRHSVATGEDPHRVLWAFGVFAAITVPVYVVLGGPIVFDRPEVVGRQLDGGASISANPFALLMALVLYTASYVAEIVRGSIQAVSKGQTEAATALALTPFQRLRFIVLPQAFRIAIPPTANQYLNLTKNSSLGIAVGAPEITQVTVTMIGNGHPAPQAFAILMLIYLSFSLAIAAVTNLVNRRFQLVER